MDSEFHFHIEMETERLASEMQVEPREARRLALAAFGGVENHKEALRQGRGAAWLSGLSLDLKLGARMLVKYPGLTVVGTFALAVAIAIGAIYFEFVRDLYDPELPVDHAAEVVGIRNWSIITGQADDHAASDIVRWRHELTTIQDVSTLARLERNLITDDGRSEPVAGSEMSASGFRVMRVPPLFGRPLLDSDEASGALPVVVLTYGVWQTRFASDSNIIGRTVRLGASVLTVVGVMPAHFPGRGVISPLRLDEFDTRPDSDRSILAFGRLAHGASIEQAQTELTTLASRHAHEAQHQQRNVRTIVKPFLESVRGKSLGEDALERNIVYATNLFFIGLLAVCCVNVATLVFARTVTREGEMAVRTALGASRKRIVMQLFAEAAVFTTVASTIGLVVAIAGMRWVRAVIGTATEQSLPTWSSDLSTSTMIYVAVLAVLSALLVGVLPALKATGSGFEARLKRAAPSGSAMQFGGMWTGVIVSQVGLTVIFLLIVVSIGWNVHIGRFGGDALALPAKEYLTLRVETDGPSRSRVALAERISSDPSVSGVTLASRLPGMDHPSVWVQPDADGGSGRAQYARGAFVDDQFFGVFNATLLAGREFSPSDAEPKRRVAIVNESFVKRVFGAPDAVGRRVRIGASAPDGTPAPAYEIIGVVRDLTTARDTSATRATLYRPASRSDARLSQLAAHATNPKALATRVRGIASAADPSLRLYDIVPMNELGKAEEALILNLIVRVLAIVGAIALVLSTAGVYSLLSFTVARRTREIGIRVALGAEKRRIISATFSRGIRQIGLGILAGSVPGTALVVWGAPEVAEGAGASGGLVAVAVVGAFMMLVGAMACVVPAMRALRIEPTIALKTDG